MIGYTMTPKQDAKVGDIDEIFSLISKSIKKVEYIEETTFEDYYNFPEHKNFIDKLGGPSSYKREAIANNLKFFKYKTLEEDSKV